MKAKAKTALECELNTAIYGQRKVEVESAFGHIKGNRSFRGFLLRGLQKVSTEFGIVALAHNFLKVAGFRQSLPRGPDEKSKTGGGKQFVSLHLFYFRNLLDSPDIMLFSLLKY
ncbi:transposase [Sporosarcina sp. OR05]|uniref:transposase n=1 Tax=Sporosarcina sp. OR05 TaxID=2969819 RepID=UPI00352A5E0F